MRMLNFMAVFFMMVLLRIERVMIFANVMSMMVISFECSMSMVMDRIFFVFYKLGDILV